MASKMLKDILSDDTRRRAVVTDCVILVDEEVAAKSGLSGLAIKGTFGIVKAVKKDIIRESVDHLLDGFIAQLEPLYARQQAAATESFSALLRRIPSEVADALLALTDDKAKTATNQVLKKAYAKLRPMAKDHVQAAVPGIARLMDKHVQG